MHIQLRSRKIWYSDKQHDRHKKSNWFDVLQIININTNSNILKARLQCVCKGIHKSPYIGYCTYDQPRIPVYNYYVNIILSNIDVDKTNVTYNYIDSGRNVIKIDISVKRVRIKILEIFKIECKMKNIRTKLLEWMERHPFIFDGFDFDTIVTLID